MVDSSEDEGVESPHDWEGDTNRADDGEDDDDGVVVALPCQHHDERDALGGCWVVAGLPHLRLCGEESTW